MSRANPTSAELSEGAPADAPEPDGGGRRGPYDHQQHEPHGHDEHHRPRPHQRTRQACDGGHLATPPEQAAPGSGVCAPWTYLVKNCATRASVALFTVSCLPQALSIRGSFWSATGLIRE